MSKPTASDIGRRVTLLKGWSTSAPNPKGYVTFVGEEGLVDVLMDGVGLTWTGRYDMVKEFKEEGQDGRS